MLKCQHPVPCLYPSPQSLYQRALLAWGEGGFYSGFGHWLRWLQKGKQPPVDLTDSFFLHEEHQERPVPQLGFRDFFSLWWDSQCVQSLSCNPADLLGLQRRHHPHLQLCQQQGNFLFKTTLLSLWLRRASKWFHLFWSLSLVEGAMTSPVSWWALIC